MYQQTSHDPTDIEHIRKNAHILIIDDQAWPHQRQLTKDRFHVTRWPDVKEVDQLTNGHFSLVLLDVHGVGLKIEPNRQGLGILDYIKKTNPAQLVIVYSAMPQSINDSETVVKADAIMGKGSTYLEFRDKIDYLLRKRADPGYFIARMNDALGADAAKVPKAVPYALKALNNGDLSKLLKYLNKRISNEVIEDLIASIIRVGFKALMGSD